MTPLTKTTNNIAQPLYVLRRISDKFVINARAVSNTTGAPNAGEDQEYLPILIDVAPDNDPLFTVRTQIEGPNEQNKTWEIRYVVADRPKEEQLAAIDNVKRFEATKHVPSQDFTEMIVLTLAAVLRDAKGLELTPQEQQAKDDLIVIATALRQNVDNAEQLKAASNAGAKVDVTAGWAVAK